MFESTNYIKRAEGACIAKYSLSPLRIRNRLKNKTHVPDETELIESELHKQSNAHPSDQISLEVAGDRLLRKGSECKPIRKKYPSTRDSIFKKLSLCRGRERQKTEETPPPQPNEEISKQYLDNLQLIKQLLARCNMKGIEQHQLDKLVHTYGLKIESMRYNISVRPKITSGVEVRTVYPQRQSSSKPRICNMNRQQRKERQPVVLQDLIKRNIKRQLDSDSKFKVVKDCSQSMEIVETVNEALNIRLRKFREFLFVVNMSNRIYRQLEFQSYTVPQKYWIGRGNNAQLIRSILKKRFWLVETSSLDESNLVWTQIKIERLYKDQLSQQLVPDALHELIAPEPVDRKTFLKTFQSPTDPVTSSLANLTTNQDLMTYKRHQILIRQLRNQPPLQIRSRMMGLPPAKQVDRLLQLNHLPNNGVLGNKKALFYLLKEYCELQHIDVFRIVPLTFHVQRGVNDSVYHQFVEAFNHSKGKQGSCIWIVKPGEHTNRGSGITCCNSLSAVRKILNGKESARTYILQKYITNPLLYNGRKFDIRVYMLLTVSNGLLKGYWYRQGYVRTASCKFDLKHLEDQMVHLTNDAIQKNGQGYGKFEEGNKLSFSDLNRYIRSNSKGDFYGDILPQMKKVASQCVEGAYLLLDPARKINNFELFGLDFMIDDALHPWLLEVNTNPCLELCCGILERLIPTMLENAFRIAVDPQFPPPSSVPWCQRHNISESPSAFNKFELIFDELRDGNRLRELYKNSKLSERIGDASQDKHEYQEFASVQPTPADID